MTDYKDYSLQQLENWIHDALSSAEASPHEIYSAIKKAVQEEYNIHKEYSQKCFGLLELLNGHRPVSFGDYISPFDYNDQGVFGSDIINFNIDKMPEKWTLPVEVDAASGEYYLQLPDDLLDTLKWKEGDTLEYSDNGDGSFSVRKVTKPIGMDEC